MYYAAGALLAVIAHVQDTAISATANTADIIFHVVADFFF